MGANRAENCWPGRNERYNTLKLIYPSSSLANSATVDAAGAVVGAVVGAKTPNYMPYLQRPPGNSCGEAVVFVIANVLRITALFLRGRCESLTGVRVSQVLRGFRALITSLWGFLDCWSTGLTRQARRYLAYSMLTIIQHVTPIGFPAITPWRRESCANNR